MFLPGRPNGLVALKRYRHEVADKMTAFDDSCARSSVSGELSYQGTAAIVKRSSKKFKVALLEQGTHGNFAGPPYHSKTQTPR